MEDTDGIGDNEVDSEETPFTPSKHEGDEVTSGDVIGPTSEVTVTYPPPKKKKTSQQRVDDLTDTIKNFRIAHAGVGLLRGSFGELPHQFTSLEQQLEHIERVVSEFKLEGDELTISGSFDKGYTVQRENECVGCEGGTIPPSFSCATDPPPDTIILTLSDVVTCPDFAPNDFNGSYPLVLTAGIWGGSIIVHEPFEFAIDIDVHCVDLGGGDFELQVFLFSGAQFFFSAVGDAPGPISNTTTCAIDDSTEGGTATITLP